MLKITPRLIAIPLSMLLLLLGLAAVWAVTQARREPLEVYGDAPAWTLTDQAGRQVSSQDLQGKVAVADFVYTHCTDTCPTLSLRMKLLQQRLRDEGLLGEEVQLLSFSTDPERDTPEVLTRYAEQWDADPQAWHFLTGPEDTVRSVIVDGFFLGVQDIPAAEATPHVHADGVQHHHEYDVMHSNKFVLIDREGRIRALYDGLTLDPERVVTDIKGLLG